jgi:hypothetical protein
MVLPRTCNGIPPLAIGFAWAALGSALAASPRGALPRELFLVTWGLGFAGNLIFAMGPHRISTFGGRAVPPRGGMLAVFASINLATLAGLAHALRPGPVTFLLWTLLVLAAALAYGGLIVWLLRSPRVHAAPRPPKGQEAIDHLVRRLDWATLFYLLLFALIGLLQKGLVSAATWHLYLAGFVALTLQGCTLHLLPRFFHATPPVGLVRVLVPASIAGPVLLALTMTIGGPPFVFAAVVEATGLVLFASAVLHVSVRPGRITGPLYVMSAMAALAGVGLGVAFAVFPPLRLVAADSHVWVQLAGFVGLGFLGLTSDVAAPWARWGARASRRWVRVVSLFAPVGLLAATAGLLSQTVALTRIGLSIVAFSFALHAWGFLVNSLPVPSRRVPNWRSID